ncbi:tail fiber protein [Erwinia phage vB_EamM_Asesino]|uniref:Uncharacterized protein n=1 Tax=Erwinia phage vB_EamM_Asesino TaxID=1883370 RepID=A0A1B2IA45_9CAUD|nr:tail fiber protein [Erwinia phage vB_EamM_Asesino]ANZ48153.1 hypothetical protein ASESINO_140 [Erwinia phage vB_EamM_Asesino]
MAAPVKKKRLHELDVFSGDKKDGVLLFSKDGKEYQIAVSALGDAPGKQLTQSAPAGSPLVLYAGTTDWVLNLNEAKKTLTIEEWPTVPVGQRIEITLTMVQVTGANKVAWPTNVKWPNDAEPPLSYTKDAEDMVLLTSVDSGKTWRGLIIAMGY